MKNATKISSKTLSRVLSLSLVVLSLSAATSAFAKVVTVEGTIDKVVPEKTEIYVLADGKKHEFYFSEKTEIVKAGQPVAFDTLKKAGKVKVTADKVGKRYDPLKVELLD